MKTLSKESETKSKLLDSATQLMLAKGYVATSVDEICKEANVTKGSFFHYFKNKEELGKVVLSRFVEMQGQLMQDQIFSKTEDPLERIYGLIDFGIQASQDPHSKGCLVGTFAQEISETHPELRDVCSACFKQFAELVREELVKARAKYKPKKDFDVNGVADFFMSVIQGSIVIVKARQEPAIMKNNLILFKEYISSFFGN